MMKKVILGVLAACASILGASAAHATTIGFTGIGSGSDGPLSASATVTTSTGLVTVTLTNTLAISQLISAGQALSDFSFTLSNAPGTLGATTAAGQLGNVSGSGVVTYTAGTPSRFLGTSPGGFSISGNTVLLETIGGGKPTQMIAPSIANLGTYTSVNNGFQQFDPYTIGPATFTLALSGVTTGTTVTGAQFSFGTSPDTFITGTPTPSPVPEPSSLMLLGTGVAGMAGLVRRRISRS